MSFNPYSHLARVAGFFGGRDLQEIASAGAQGQNAVPGGSGLAAGLSGLGKQLQVGPARRGAPNPSASGGASSFLAGNTRAVSDQRVPGFRDGATAASLELKRLSGGGVEIRLRRSSPYADSFTEADQRVIERLVRVWERDARALSRGRLTTQRLARMNHPYGRGIDVLPGLRIGRSRRSDALRRKPLAKNLAPKRLREQGLSNLSVVNRHSGEFESEWSSHVEWDRRGATLVLSNQAPYAGFLAFGTAKMTAHGPFAVAPTLFLSRLNAAWRQSAKRAYLRQNALAGIRSSAAQREWAKRDD